MEIRAEQFDRKMEPVQAYNYSSIAYSEFVERIHFEKTQENPCRPWSLGSGYLIWLTDEQAQKRQDVNVYLPEIVIKTPLIKPEMFVPIPDKRFDQKFVFSLSNLPSLISRTSQFCIFPQAANPKQTVVLKP